MIECCAGWTTAARQGLVNARQRAQKEKIDRASAARLKARARLEKTMEVNFSEEDNASRVTSVQMEGLPPAISAMIVVVLGIAEAILGLYPFYLWVAWKKSFFAGLIAKW